MSMAAYLRTDLESELFNLLEIIIEFKLNAIRMHVPVVDDTELTIL